MAILETDKGITFKRNCCATKSIGGQEEGDFVVAVCLKSSTCIVGLG